MRPLLCPSVVGREEELATLRAAVGEAAAGHGGVVLLVGEAGIGKSRLAAEARRLAREAGMGVRGGRAVQRAVPLPYRPLAEAIQSGHPLDASSDQPALAPFHRALRWLLPETDEEAAEPGKLAVAEALARTLGAVGRSRGCLLVLEDLHWADPETLAVVEYLADHLGDQAALVLGTLRSGEGTEAERLATLLGERRAAAVVRLGPLGRHAMGRMLAACLGTDAVPRPVEEFVHSRADGVPLFVEELLTGLAEAQALVPRGGAWQVRDAFVPVVPLTHVEAVRRRLQGLERPEREVVLAAAVLGRRFDWSLLPPTTGQAEAEVLEALRRATASHLVVPDEAPVGFRFRHALTRDVVLGELLPPEQAAVAARALDAVAAAHPGLPGGWAGLAADLAERAGDRPRAVSALVEIGLGALRRGALASARATVDRAGALAGADPELSLIVDEAAAQVAALAGDVDEAIRRTASVLAALPAGAGSQERRARLHLSLARAALTAGRWADARRHVDDARSLAGAGPGAGRATVEALAAQVAMAEGRLDEAAATASAAVELARAASAPAAGCEALEVLGRVARQADLDEAERLFGEALRLAERHDLALWRARALHELGTIDLLGGRREDRLAAAREAAVEAGAVATIALCDLHLAAMASAGWDTRRGIEAARRCVDLSRRLGLNTLGMGLVHLASCQAMAGLADDMEASLAEARRVAGGDPDVAAGIPGRARTTLALRRGDPRAAMAALDEAVAVLRQRPGAHFPFWGLWALLHTVHDDGGGGDQARAEAGAAPGRSTRFNRIGVELAEAVALGRGGGGAEATGAVRRTLADQGALGGGAWDAVVLAVVASSALRHGWGDGPRWARRALARFEADHLGELASWCRSLLRAAGEPVPRRGRGTSPVPPGLRALGVTSREVDVLGLLAGGASNPEIARRLHLSPRTVDRHVSNLLSKTSASDRRALALLAAEAGVPAPTG